MACLVLGLDRLDPLITAPVMAAGAFIAFVCRLTIKLTGGPRRCQPARSPIPARPVQRRVRAPIVSVDIHCQTPKTTAQV